jgi:hypothetical protein
MDCQTHSLASAKVAVVQRNYDRNWKQDICWKTLLVRNFLVMDDLLIQPMSTVSSTITLLNNLNIKEIGTFQEKVVEMGMDEVRFSNFCISILIYKFRFSCIFCSILNRESRCLKLLCNRRWS